MPDTDAPTRAKPEIAPEFFLKRYRDIEEMRDLSEEAKADLKAELEKAKGSGIDLKALKWLRWLRKMDPREAQSAFRHTILYLSWLGINFLDQEEAFADGGPATSGLTAQVVATQARWEAGRAGYEAGKSGTPLDGCPYPPGSEEHQAWCTEWRDGVTDRPAGKGDDKRKGGDERYPEDGGGEDPS